MFSGKQDIYLEVAERYEKYIHLGILKEGDKLPSVRTAAAEMHVNPNTVQKAYTLLEKKDLITTLPKKGVFVTYRSDIPDRPHPLIQKILALKEEGYTEEALQAAIKEVYSQ